MPVTIQRADHQIANVAFLGARQFAQIFLRLRIQIHNAFRQARPDRELIHVDIGRMQKAALFRQRHSRNRIRPALGGDGGTLQRVHRDIHFRPAADLGVKPDFLADIEHRRLIHLALADYHCAGDGDGIEGLAHGFHRGAIGGVLVAPANPAGGCECSGFRHAHQFKRQVAVNNHAGGRGGGGFGHGQGVSDSFRQDLARRGAGCPLRPPLPPGSPAPPGIARRDCVPSQWYACLPPAPPGACRGYWSAAGRWP